MAKSKEELAKKVYLKYIDGEGSLTKLGRKYGVRRETVWKWTKRMELSGDLVRGTTKKISLAAKIMDFFGF